MYLSLTSYALIRKEQHIKRETIIKIYTIFFVEFHGDSKKTATYSVAQFRKGPGSRGQWDWRLEGNRSLPY